LGVRSPLLGAGFRKRDIREASKALGLPTASQPSYACLATRFPYHTEITDEALVAVDQAETRLHELGFSQVRVRVHENVARVELDPSELPRASDDALREKIVRILKDGGFQYATLDLEGYRTGSMDEGDGMP